MYWHPLLYNLTMRCLYGGTFSLRYEAVVQHVEPHWSVLDVCCGDAYLRKYLRETNTYLGVDSNPRFIKSAERKGIQARVLDILTDPWPEADCVVMMGGLYQFFPHHDEVLSKALLAAKARLIISEPIINLSSSRIPFVAAWAKRLSHTGSGASDMRFTRETLIPVLERHHPAKILEAGRELIGIYDTGSMHGTR